MSDSSTRRVTLADVARAAGVSTFTASHALRGIPDVKPATRDRVIKAAGELGYHLNEAASLLARQRTEHTEVSRIRIGVLSELPQEQRLFRTHTEDFDVDIEMFTPSSFPSPETASRILWHRGIKGLFINTNGLRWTLEERARFDWSRFALVQNSRSLPDLKCHLIRHSPYDYMETVLSQVIARGYRRISILPATTPSRRDNAARFGAFASQREEHKDKGVELFWHQTPALNPEYPKAIAWAMEKKPDAIVAFHHSMIYHMHSAGIRIPEDVGFASILSDSNPTGNPYGVAGCDTQFREHYRRALRFLIDMIGRGEYGFQNHITQHVVEPVWYEGRTLPNRRAG